MSDQIDRAQELEHQQREIALKNRAISMRSSAFFCEDCGNEIPEKRRKSIIGVTRCVICQEIIERKAREYRR